MRLLVAIVVALIGGWSVPAQAGMKPSLRAAVDGHFAPAQPHRGLETAQEPIDAAKVHTYVTLAHGAIAAAKAEWFVTNQAYEYRPVLIDVAKGTITTRRGKVYTYLDRGVVMMVTATEYSGNTIYLKLLSADVHRSMKEKHPSRVGVMLGFKFPAAQLSDSNANAVIAEIQKWVRPFRDYRAAAEFSAQLVRSAAPQ